MIVLAVVYPAPPGSEFMPTLNEGTLLTCRPAAGDVDHQGRRADADQNKIIKSFPEVASVYSKAGRANTATDPAPTEMFETVINLKPESEWRPGMTTDKLIAEMDKALQFPAWPTPGPCPSRPASTCLSTGIRTPIGIKVFGKDLGEMERWRARSRPWSSRCRNPPGLRRAHHGALPQYRTGPGITGRYGLGLASCRTSSARRWRGMVTTTVEGRERFGVTVRYLREPARRPAADRP